MNRPLAGHLVLVVEDEPLIALDIAQGLEGAGARAILARTLSDALTKAEDPALSAAVLDHRLNDGDTSEVCDRLKERGIPFVLYSGYSNLEGPCSEGVQVPKPAQPSIVIATLTGLLRQRPILN